jgi:polyketide synthase PksN
LYPADNSWEASLLSRPIEDGLEEAARRWPDAPAIEFNETMTSFAELRGRSARVARGLQDIGVKPGSNVALLLKNTPCHVICFYAILLAGARVVNLSSSMSIAELRQQIKKTDVDVIISSEPFCARLSCADGTPGANRRVVICSETQSDFQDAEPCTPDDRSLGGSITLGRLAANDGAFRRHDRGPAEQEVAVLQFTGGTTGLPKAAMLTHENFSAIPHAMTLWAGDVVAPGRVLLVVLPLSHVFGLALMCLSIANGLKMILHASFDADRVLDEIQHKGVSIFFGVPMMYTALVQKPRTRQTDWSRVRICGSGGSPLSADLFTKFRECTRLDIREGYSLTEIADLGTWQPIDRPAIPGTVGIPFPLTKMEIVDLDRGTEIVPVGEIGEICFQGPQLMKGYWKQPEETAEAMRGGRFHTGDIGFLDQHGYLTLVDRKKDMLIVAGHKVFSKRVEAAIGEHPAVAEVCLIGLPSAEAGHLPKAVVTLRPGHTSLTLVELKKFLRDRLGRYEIPLALDVVAELPRLGTGKIAKSQLLLESMPTDGAAQQAQERGAIGKAPREMASALACRICLIFMEVGQPDAASVTPGVRLESCGMDSLTVVAVHARLLEHFPQLSSTVFFEFATIAELATHMAETFSDAAARWLESESGNRPPDTVAEPSAERIIGAPSGAAGRQAGADSDHAIAIIGLSGRYAKARTLDEYWANLKSGRDCMSEIPAERWSLEESYTPDPPKAIAQGKSYCKWLGYLEGFADFDPLFFGIAPKDALAMDPQERLFLQACWEALEDAAYTRESLKKKYRGSVGVFAGITNMGYDLYGPGLWARGLRLFPYTWFSSLANRVSYLFDLHGPSMPIDTMCSSSITAIHEACQHIRRGECDMAFAGGVNVYVHPAVHAVLCMRRMLSIDGRSKAFGAGANGYAPGEGAGVVVLKRLSEAIADGDHVHAVIRGSSINHGGRTNGYTVPSPTAQAALIRQALDDAGVSAREISYVEAHGTGTELGDPIEIAGLHRAFLADTDDKGFCAIGSVKSNVGHCESAAGMAGLTKVILQMRHAKLVPSLHVETINPRIDFASTAFHLQKDLTDWSRPVVTVDGVTQEIPRIAGISSFGAGGANAHMIVEEYVPSQVTQASGFATDAASPALIVLSAATRTALGGRAAALAAVLAQPPAAEMTLANIAYTLQVGREAMRYRLALVASSIDDLRERLLCFVRDVDSLHGAMTGEVLPGSAPDTIPPDDDERMLDAWTREGDLVNLARSWVDGREVDWERLAPGARRQRVPLPVYRFEGERYWVADLLAAEDGGAASPSGIGAGLHPLVQINTSTFSTQRFTSSFEGREFFLHDHIENGHPAMPAMALPEMVLAALNLSRDPVQGMNVAAMPGQRSPTALVLENVVWAKPFVVNGSPSTLHIELNAADEGSISFAVVGPDRESYARGNTWLVGKSAAAKLDVASLLADCTETVDVDRCYSTFAAAGRVYGPAFRVLQNIAVGTLPAGGIFALGRIVLPAAGAARSKAIELHPAMLDGAVQVAAGLACSRLAQGDRIGFTAPFAMDSLEILQSIPADGMFAFVRRAADRPSTPSESALDVDLVDADGHACIRIRGLAGETPPATVQEGSGADTLFFCPRRQDMAWPARLLPAEAPLRDHWIVFASLGNRHPLRRADSLESAIVRAFPDARAVDLGDALDSEAVTFEQQVERLLTTIQEALRSKNPTLLQVIATASGADGCLAGLSGMLATAAMEDPNLIAQLVLLATDSPSSAQTIETLKGIGEGGSGTVRLGDTLSIERFEECVLPASAPNPWRDGGVYLISGGGGAIGLLFAEEIARRTRDAAVVLVSRGELTSERSRRLDALSARGLRVHHLRLDVGDGAAVQRGVAETVERFGRLDGVLHAAGVIRDDLLSRKNADDLHEVLIPKVAGLRNLDEATRDLPLNFFVCFSSTAALGNVGQSDYATANAFLDAYVGYRNELVSRGRRHGATVSINWPLWQDGGMTVSSSGRTRMKKEWGVVPLPRAVAMDAFARVMSSGRERVVLTHGEADKLRRAMAMISTVASSPGGGTARSVAAAPSTGAPEPALIANTESLIKQVFTKTTGIELSRLDADASFNDYGIDSILIMDMTEELEKTLGPLSKTLFFEFPSIAKLTRELVGSHAAKLASTLGLDRPTPPAVAPDDIRVGHALAPLPPAMKAKHAPGKAGSMADHPERAAETGRRFNGIKHRSRSSIGDEPIAVIGVRGFYPGAADLESHWRNLQACADCIVEIDPAWVSEQTFHPDPATALTLGRNYCKWGGRLDPSWAAGLDTALFPNAMSLSNLDPIERMFLRSVHDLLRDARYDTCDADEREARPIGLFVCGSGSSVANDGTDYAAAPVELSGGLRANRISFMFDLCGPSMAVDTMSSSSLAAVHYACLSLRHQECRSAIAGGFSILSPDYYRLASQLRFLGSRANSRSFTAGDGYLPGECAGAVLLKPLRFAEEDGDTVLALIRSTVTNHTGRFIAPFTSSPRAQSRLVEMALKAARVEPRSISYVESAANGSVLGDAVEFSALSGVFRRSSSEAGYCALGSIKANIGHAAAASGISQLTKVVLQLQHGILVPTRLAGPLNPDICFQNSPFRLPDEAAEWRRPVMSVDGVRTVVSRRALVNSFGAGGSYVSAVLEEYGRAG